MRAGREKSSLPVLLIGNDDEFPVNKKNFVQNDMLMVLTSVTILSGGTSNNGFKRFCKITGAGKTAAVTNINDTLFPGIQHMTGFFNPVMDQVLNGRLLDDVAEGTLYFPFTDIGSLRQLF